MYEQGRGDVPGKTFQESPRNAPHTAATGKRGSVASVEGSCGALLKSFPRGAAASFCMLVGEVYLGNMQKDKAHRRIQ